MPEEIFEIVAEIFTSGADSTADGVGAIAEGSEALAGGADAVAEGDGTSARRTDTALLHGLFGGKKSEDSKEYDEQQDLEDYSEQLFES